MRATILLPLLLCATPAFSQAFCEEPSGPIETCLVGAWVGSSTIPEALEQMMRSMPDNVAASFSSFGQPVGMIIYDDGFYETFPIAAEGFATFVDDRGSVTEFQMNAQTITTAGYISAIGGTLDICYLPGGAGGIAGEMTVTADGGSATVPLSAPSGPQSFSPVITYTCSGDTMQQFVALPAPLGTITYDLIRVPNDAFPFAMRGAAGE